MDIIYLKIARISMVQDKIIKLSDVGKVETKNEKMAQGLRNLVIADLNQCSKMIQESPEVEAKDKKENLDEVKKGKEHYAMSVLKVIEKINKKYPEAQVVNLGETDFIIKYVKEMSENKKSSMIKAIGISIIVFFGSAFTIIGFNNDISISVIFAQIYEITLGTVASDLKLLEIGYSIGLAVGIIIFYNHFGTKKLTMDPTPIQVEMRLYEDDISTCVIKQQERKGKTIDVD